MTFLLAEVNPIVHDVLIPIGIALVAALIVVAIFRAIKAHKDAKRAKEQQERQEEISEGVKEVLREIREEYLVMSRNVTYNVGADGEIAPGRYVIKSSVEGVTQFNVRHNGYVQGMTDGQILTLGAGDTVCPVSNSVLLKPYVDPKYTADDSAAPAETPKP